MFYFENYTHVVRFCTSDIFLHLLQLGSVYPEEKIEDNYSRFCRPIALQLQHQQCRSIMKENFLLINIYL